MDWKVRLSTVEDVPGVAAALQSAYPILMAPAYDPETLARALPSMIRPNLYLLGSGRYFVAEVGKRIIGAGGWSHEAPGAQGGAVTRGLAHLRHFAVHADWSGRGVGRSLYAACAAQCIGEGVVELEVISTLNGEVFYRALGFETEAAIEIEMAGLRLPSLRMRRRLG